MAQNTSQIGQQPDGDGDEGVVIPEEFQKKVHAMVHKAPKAHLDHISDRVNNRRDEIRMAEQAKMTKGKGPAEFSTAQMPG